MLRTIVLLLAQVAGPPGGIYSVPGSYGPTLVEPMSIFQAVVDTAPPGATLYVDDYPPKVKRGIIVLNKPLTLVGGTYAPAWQSYGPALQAQCMFGGEIVIRSAHVTQPGRGLFAFGRVRLEQCWIEGGVASGGNLTITGCLIEGAPDWTMDPSYDIPDGTTTVTAWTLHVENSIITGGAGATIYDPDGLFPFSGRGGDAVNALVLEVDSASQLIGGHGTRWYDVYGDYWEGPSGDPYDAALLIGPGSVR